MKAHLRNVRISPKKMSIVAKLIRGKKVNDALNFLKFAPKKAANLLYKVVSSAAANAENNFKQKKDDLAIRNIIVTQGPTFKRGLPVSRGRWHPIKKRTSHVTVTVEVPETTIKKKKTAVTKTTKDKIAQPKTVSAEEGRQLSTTKPAQAKGGDEVAAPEKIVSKAEQSEGKISTPTPRKTG